MTNRNDAKFDVSELRPSNIGALMGFDWNQNPWELALKNMVAELEPLIPEEREDDEIDEEALPTTYPPDDEKPEREFCDVSGATNSGDR